MTKTIKICACKECPWRELFTGGKKIACGHIKVSFLKPYAVDRFVDPDTFPTWCPL
jgi:hypothetical protein